MGGLLIQADRPSLCVMVCRCTPTQRFIFEQFRKDVESALEQADQSVRVETKEICGEFMPIVVLLLLLLNDLIQPVHIRRHALQCDRPNYPLHACVRIRSSPQNLVFRLFIFFSEEIDFGLHLGRDLGLQDRSKLHWQTAVYCGIRDIGL